jgi:phosphoribosylaminoimidazolecarboxamide formyltransferase/IMP cyclohydrolase
MRALVSVSDKRGIQAFCEALVAMGYEIISTGGTANVLRDSGIPVIPVESVTDFPEMMDGRIKTLHPKIHGGLLARRSDPAHVDAANRHGITLIDVVVVNLYPFESTIQNSQVTLAEAIETIDIGGPAMIRSAAKNFESVAVVVDPDRYDEVIANMHANQGTVSPDYRQSLAIEAFAHTAQYDTIIANYLTTRQSQHTGTDFPHVVAPILTKRHDLRYGENPHQKAAFYAYSHGAKGFGDIKHHHGKALSYNNIVDLEAAWHIVRDCSEPAVAIVKHTNPCGVAVAASLSTAYQRAYDADPVSAFGSVIGCNRPIDLDTATLLSTLFVEAVIAPGFSPEALQQLVQKPSIRLIEMPHFFDADTAFLVKYVQGGILLQTPDTIITDESLSRVVTTTRPENAIIPDLHFAYAVCKHVKSNAIVLVKNGQTCGIGAGQMSRIESVAIAIKQAGPRAVGAVCASDAFFPFGDSVNALAAAGISAIIQPGGSVRDQESIDACNDHGMAMVFTGIRHFKH